MRNGLQSSSYVVRKIRASIAAGEQPEKPQITPRRASAEMKAEDGLGGGAPSVALIPAPKDVSGAQGSRGPSKTAGQNCGS